MSKTRRKFSVDQKLQIIQEADQAGITQTLRKHNLSHSVFLRWKQAFNNGGVGSLIPQYHKMDPEVRALQEENAMTSSHISGRVKLENSGFLTSHASILSFPFF